MFLSGVPMARLKRAEMGEAGHPWLAGARFLAFLALAGLLSSCGRAPGAPEFSEFDAGIAYTAQRVKQVPWQIHVVRLDRSAPDLEFRSIHAHGASVGLSALTDQIESIKPRLGLPLAGINGDFYQFEGTPYAGDPRGLQIADGELLSAPNGGVTFWIDAEGRPRAANVASRLAVTWPNGATSRFGFNESRLTNTVVLYTAGSGPVTLNSNGVELVLEAAGSGPWLPLRLGAVLAARISEVRFYGRTRLTPQRMVLSIHPVQTNRPPAVELGDIVQLSFQSLPDLSGLKMAIGGGPVLVHEGKRQKLKEPKMNGPLPYEYRSMRERHPRTALGWNDRYYYLVVVDGRQKNLSEGMTLAELSRYMIKLGCREVVNFDGGGSATIWCDGQVVNSPCDGWEREIANGLVVVRKKGSDLKATLAAPSAN